MKKIVFLLLVICIVSCNEKSETKEERISADTSSARKEIIALMDSMNSALKSKNVQSVMTFFTEDGLFYGTDPKEVWNKKQFTDEVSKTLNDSSANVSYEINKRDIIFDDDAHSAIVIEQFYFPMMSNKIMTRGIGRVDRKNNTWRIDFYSWNLIPKNEDIPKMNKALE